MNLPGIQAAIDAVASLFDELCPGSPALDPLCPALRLGDDPQTAERVEHAAAPHINALVGWAATGCAPHRLEVPEFGGRLVWYAINGYPHIELAGWIYPTRSTPYEWPAPQARLAFRIIAKSAEQFAAQLGALKAGADAIQAAGY